MLYSLQRGHALKHHHPMSPSRTMGKDRFPRRWNQSPWGTTDKGVSPSEQNQSQIMELPPLSRVTLELERTTNYFVTSILPLSKWECSSQVSCPCRGQECQTHFHQAPHQPHGCLQRTECNFNSTVKE